MRTPFPSKASSRRTSPNTAQRPFTRFTIKIEQEWLDSLETLIGLIRNQSVHTPEEVLEKAIFSQIDTQLTHNR